MGAYKQQLVKSTCGSVVDAINTLRDELGQECRDICDNASDGLQQTQRIQTFDETAGTLEGLSDIDVPTVVDDLPIEYNMDVNKRKGASPSRSTRCANEVAILYAAEAAAQAWLDDEANAEHEDRDDVETFVSECSDAASSCEGCEFPGMYG